MRCAWCYAARSCSHRHSAVLPVSVRPVQLDNGSGGEGKQDDAAQTRAPRAPRAPVNRHSRQNKKAQRTAEAFSLCLIATRRLAVLYACFYFTTSMNQRQIDHAAFADLKSKALNATNFRLNFCGFYHKANRPSSLPRLQPLSIVQFRQHSVSLFVRSCLMPSALASAGTP